MAAVPGMFDVFLNHRGPDVKKAFLAHLHEALKEAGLHPFLDMESLDHGQHAQTSIFQALRGASVHVAIFSEHYAESEYCLNELCEMLESEKPVIPVFYNVSPQDLSCKLSKGPYSEAFHKCHKRQPVHQVKEWKEALSKAAELFGFNLADYYGNEAQMKREIVTKVQEALRPFRLQRVAQFRVGLDKPSESVIKTLNEMGDAVGVLSLVGMGGIGKTTLAKEVYNHFAKDDRKFEKQTFLSNVRESVKEGKILDLQKQLIRDLLQEDVRSTEEFNHWFNRLFGRKVLIVMDDIDQIDAFDELVPNIDKLHQSSRVLITSRDLNLVANIKKKGGCKHATHDMVELGNAESRQLFNKHAFHSMIAIDGFQDLAKQAADACKGLPLALEVIGSFLFDKIKQSDFDCWRHTIKTLHERTDILDKLKVSYDGLSTAAGKLMFLDIACFLIGKHEHIAMQILEACKYNYEGPIASFRSLKDKSLVKLDGDGRIVMHDLLRDLGREVVMNQSRQDNNPPSHLWDPIKATRVLQRKEGTKIVRGLSVAGAGNGPACVAENYTNMSELHFLLLDGCDVKGDFSTWSQELSWLQWRSSHLSILPLKQDQILNLAVLDLTDNKSLTHIWPSDLEFPCEQLKTLILENCNALQELPNIGKLSRLKQMNMKGCSTLKALPESVGQLKELEHLNLSQCAQLVRLPDSIVHLSKLKIINLNECTQLTSLPEALGELQSLVEFWADGSSLSELPNTFSTLSNLEHLHLFRCLHIRNLPSSMIGLGKLKVLHLGKTGVEKLPDDFGKLGSLTELLLHECESLKALPENFGLLSELRKLVMHHNENLVKLPEGFGRLQALEELDLGNCSIQEKGLSSDFGNLSALKTLILQYNKLAALPEALKDLRALVFFEIHHCPNLIDVQALPSNLEHLDIGDCPELTTAFVGNMSSLKQLRLCNCIKLAQLEGLESLPALVEVNVSGCTMLENASGLNHNKALEQCHLSGSNISMKYDDDWLKEEPAIQVVSYYENTLVFAHNGMAQKVTSKEWANEVCMETIITDSKECIAIIFSFVAHDQGWSDYSYDHGRYNSWCSMEARIVRNNQEVYVSSLFHLRHADNRNQMYLCTLRRLHPFVRALQHGDKIHVYARSIYPRWAITVEQGAICVVHVVEGELDHENVHVVMNGGNEAHPTDESVSVSLDEVKVKFARLQLADNLEYKQTLLQEAPNFGAFFPNLKINLEDDPRVYTLPESLRNIHTLVILKIYRCLNLNDVEALPQSLQCLDICECPKLVSIPSLGDLILLRFLTLCKCTKLTQIEGLDSLTTLKEVNLTGCTMLQHAIGLNHNNTLEKCYLSGSKVSMPYDSNWLKKESTQQVVSYYDNTLGFANNGMALKVRSKQPNLLCMEVQVTEPEECIAVIFSFVAHDQGWSNYPHHHGHYNSECSMEARIIRDNEEIETCGLFKLRHADNKDQVYLCTLRKLHPFVNALQHKDKIHVYAKSSYQGWTITVEEGAVCLLYAAPGELDHDEICVVVNGGIESSSSVTANLSAKEVKEKLKTLQLVDNASRHMNIVQQKMFFLVANPQTGQPMIFKCKACGCTPITTIRWHCDICPDFNLCNNCHKETSVQQVHNHEHPMSPSESDVSFIYIGSSANVGPGLMGDLQFNSRYSQQQTIPQITDGEILPP